MLTYNTHLKHLVLPEYGRNLQRMVDHCLTIEDRDERNRCARSIIAAMESLFPDLKQPENAHKVWDHLAIMSDFKLDIDYPENVVNADELKTAPEKVPYPDNPIRVRQYGHLTQAMISKATEMPEGPERDKAVSLIANQMKKQMLASNPDGVDDHRIFTDMAMLSQGAIRLTPETCTLHEYKEMPKPATGKKKKKKK